MPSKLIMTVCLLLVLSTVKAQDIVLPELPSTKEQFASSEKDVIAAAKWLETTPIGTNMDQRTKVNAWVLAWLTNSPTVTIEVKDFVTKLFNKNPQLMLVWMAGYTRYVLENSYSKDEVKGNTAGLKSVIACYNLGGDVKKDKELTRIIDKDKEGKLEEWVKESLQAK